MPDSIDLLITDVFEEITDDNKAHARMHLYLRGRHPRDMSIMEKLEILRLVIIDMQMQRRREE